jgi:putative mRNA 3-end processing factor
MMHPLLLEMTEAGFHCPAGGFHIDPWKPVARAVITHAHADHARSGCGRYLATPSGAALLHARLGPGATVEAIEYGRTVSMDGVRVSLHPAGHILGSAQVRIERRGETWVVTGDFKRDPDPTCLPFEPLRAHTLVTECTFGLPVFAWPAPAAVIAEIGRWWRRNREEQRCSILFAYSLGKAQRVAAVLEPVGPIFTHGAVENMTAIYRQAGVRLSATRTVSDADPRDDYAGALVIAPPLAEGTPWMRRFPDPSRAFVSGWMRIRGNRRRRGLDRGFVLSDHADWPAILATVRDSGAERVWTTHGYTAETARFLTEIGCRADPVRTPITGDSED